MTEEKSINEDVLAIIKALAEKVEVLEKTIYAKDSLLMKAGLVVTNSQHLLWIILLVVLIQFQLLMYQVWIGLIFIRWYQNGVI